MYLMKRKGSPYYFIYFFQNGKKKAVTTKEKKKAEALKFLSNFEANQTKKLVLNEISLEQFKHEYLQYIKLKYSHSHYLKNEITFKYLLKEIGDIPLKKLTSGQVENFILKWYNEKSKYTASNYFRNLRASLNYAVEHKYISDNFLSRFKFPVLPQNNPQYITEVELKQIIDKVEYENLKDIYTIYFHTGCRLRELLNLTWENVSLNEAFIKITNSSTFRIKTGKERFIPLNSVALEIFKQRLPKVFGINCGYVFNKNGVIYNGDFISKKFKKACRLAGFPNIHLHSLRHSFCSNLIAKNAPINTVMALAGHTHLRTTQQYLHVRKEQLFQTVKLLESAV